jgi:prepilin-type N-terminal cleavage/methylation domain-containing protein
MSQQRRGVTLIEMLVVLVLGGLVMSLIAQIGITLQRQFERAGAQVLGSTQLREAAAILPLDLRALSVPAGDIAAGEARDSTLEIRATIASGVVCAAETGGEGALSAVLLAFPGNTRDDLPSRLPQPGDTLWLLDQSAAEEQWRPTAVRGVREMSCPPNSPTWSGFLLDRAQHLQIDAMALAAGAVVGTAARLTRPERFSYYRANDGGWYLGLREWNATLGRFNPVQPVSGPYRTLRGTGREGAGVQFAYFDSLGEVVSSGAVDARRITRVEVTLRTAQHASGRVPADSLTIAVALRNRR